MRNIYILIIVSLFTSCKILNKTRKPPVDYSNYVPEISRADAAKRDVDSAAIKEAIKNSALQKRYARLLRVPADSINLRLYSFIDDWINTPYLWGGDDKNGIDCSAFIRRLFNDVYGLKMPRTSLEQALTKRVTRFKAKKYLAEGDILFFRTINGTIVSHVGVYLRNNWFINASSDKGVAIYNLADNYWKTHFVIAARVKTKEAKEDLSDNTIR